jgi:trehalose 6-phosphate synthase
MQGMNARVVVASNRGPVSYALADDGTVQPGRGGGGLVAGVSATAEGVWVCAALSEVDRRVAQDRKGGRLDSADTDGAAVRMLAIDPTTFGRAYNVVANSTLWFVQHLLFDTAVHPTFGWRFERDWESYVDYNTAFADAIAEEAAPGGRVLVQDYHLTLVPELLRERRPDVRIAHFSHTPWAPPEYFRVLPDQVCTAVLEGLLGADRVGFLSPRWATAFASCCTELLGARVEGGSEDVPLTVHHDGRRTLVDVHPLGVDGPGLRERAARADVEARLAVLREQVGDCLVLLRVDRTELSKNIARGLEAYRELLRRYPRWQRQVVHVAFAYPSRHDLPVYREYTGAVQRLAQEINDEFGIPGWQPVLLHVQDDYPRSLAAYRLADVLLVNPVRDGMNLVAKEAPVVSERGCSLVLSREAGAADELGADSLLVNPFDVSATAEALNTALSMDPDERAASSRRLAEAATAMPPELWLARQLESLDQLD